MQLKEKSIFIIELKSATSNLGSHQISGVKTPHQELDQYADIENTDSNALQITAD